VQHAKYMGSPAGTASDRQVSRPLGAVLVCSGCQNKTTHTTHFLSHIHGGWSPRSRYQQIRCLVKSLLLAVRTVDFLTVSTHGREREREGEREQDLMSCLLFFNSVGFFKVITCCFNI
jgi:hypothetical protein